MDHTKYHQHQQKQHRHRNKQYNRNNTTEHAQLIALSPAAAAVAAVNPVIIPPVKPRTPHTPPHQHNRYSSRKHKHDRTNTDTSGTTKHTNIDTAHNKKVHSRAKSAVPKVFLPHSPTHNNELINIEEKYDAVHKIPNSPTSRGHTVRKKRSGTILRLNEELKFSGDLDDFDSKTVPVEPEECVDKSITTLELLLKGQFEGFDITDNTNSVAEEKILDCLRYLRSAKTTLTVRNPRVEKLLLKRIKDDPTVDDEIEQFLAKNYLHSASSGRRSITKTIKGRKSWKNYKTFAEEGTSPRSSSKEIRRCKSMSSMDLAELYNSSGLAQVQLMDIHLWKFDMIQFAELVDEKPLLPVMEYIFRMHNFYQKLHLSPDVVENFFYALEMTYKDVPYHNSTHGADVAQAMNFFLLQPSLADKLTEEDKFVAVIAAAAHDVAHPGNNNQFEISTGSELAVTYNDRSVLENFHIATCFRILRSPQHNLFSRFSKEKVKYFRSQIIEMILSTDMQDHARSLAHLQATIAQKKEANSWFTLEDKMMLLDNALHCADLSNCCRPPDVNLKWTPRIYEEFWGQGDQEKSLGLPISPLCDRAKPNLEKSQIGFISFVIRPLYSTWKEVVPEAQVCLNEMEKNLKYWQEKAATLPCT